MLFMWNNQSDFSVIKCMKYMYWSGLLLVRCSSCVHQSESRFPSENKHRSEIWAAGKEEKITLTWTMASSTQQEKFCLRWNDFESNLSAAFKELRQESEYLDVTLLCEDEDQIEAHKVVLSACSGFFRNALRRTKHQHPLLYLKGVQHADLNHILDFIYYGEVSIAQENLNAFLSVAEELKIKGLTQSNLNVKENKMKTKVGARHTSQYEEVQVKHEDTSAVVSHGVEENEVFDDDEEDIQYDEENQYQDIYHSQDHQVGSDGAGSQGSRSHLSIF